MSQWSNHPATAKYGKGQLSFGQRSADVLRNAMGSWPFVFGAIHTYQIDQENLELTKQVHDLSKRIEKLTLEVHEAVKAKH